MTDPPGSLDRPRILPFGDGALLVDFGDHVDRELNAAVHRLDRVVREIGRPWLSPVPAYASLLVPYDSLEIGHGEATAAMSALVEAAGRRAVIRSRDAAADAEQRPLEIAVRYGGDAGPDLVHVAERIGLAPDDVVELHASATYVVFMLGFVPGFAYLGPLPERLALPRLAEPRTRVPAGSVAIAERQTAVYPFETPGGWHLIGRTDAHLWDPRRTPPALLAPGATVRFRPTTG
jgi:KipI family sensor histidine kinase inhibitor